MYHFLLKYIYQFKVIIFAFILVQIFIFCGFKPKPSVDFEKVYWPNALNIQSKNNTFFALHNPIAFIPDGQINRFGTMPPLYIYVLAFIVFLGGNQAWVFMINTLLLIAVLYFSKKIFELISTKKQIHYISLFILIFYPLFVLMPATYGAESLFSLFFIAGMYFYLISFKSFSYLYYLISIILILLSTETRMLSLYITPFLILPFAYNKTPWKQLIYIIAISFSGFAFIYLLNNSSVNEYYLQRTTIDGLKRHADNESAQYLIAHTAQVKSDFTFVYIKEMYNNLIHLPFSTIKLYSQKFIESWYKTDSGVYDIYILIFNVLFLLTFIFQLIYQTFKRSINANLLIICCVILYFNLIATVSFSICRYIAPVSPFIVMAFVYTLHSILTKNKILT